VSCRCSRPSRTPFFCFVHKRGICENDCLAPSANKKGEHVNCVVKTYREWLTDAEYDWPPRCSLCFQKLDDDPNNVIRLVCKCLYHRRCLAEKLKADVAAHQISKCSSCNKSVTSDNVTQLSRSVSDFIQATVGPQQSLLMPQASPNAYCAAGSSTASSFVGDRVSPPPSPTRASSSPGTEVTIDVPTNRLGNQTVNLRKSTLQADVAASSEKEKPPHLLPSRWRRFRRDARCTPQSIIVAVLLITAVCSLLVYLYATGIFSRSMFSEEALSTSHSVPSALSAVGSDASKGGPPPLLRTGGVVNTQLA